MDTTKYKFLAEADLKLTKEFFITLLDLSMRMRGWTGEEDYPVSNTKMIENDSLLLEGLFDFRQQFDNKYSDLCTFPIFLYKDGEYKMHANKTIKDSIYSILKADSMESSYRVNSNWLASTAHYYFKEYMDDSPFAIAELAHIA